MRRIQGIRPLPRVSTTGRSIQRAVDEEMRFHLQMRIEELMRQGHPRADAERRAEGEYGDMMSARAELAEIDRRAARRAGWREFVGSLMQDMRMSVRGLRARPGFTATILLTLGLGIGSNAAIFSVVYAVLVKPLPFAQPERLVHVWETFEGSVEKRSEASYPDYLDLRARSRALTDIAGFQSRGVLLGAEHPTAVGAGTVTANFFQVLGVRAAIGRTFVAGEDAVGARRVVVLSDGLWERLFGRSPRAVGATIVLESEPATVVGVLPKDFRFGGRAGAADLWMPITYGDDVRSTRGAHWLNLVGRLRDGVSVSTATGDLLAIMAELTRQYPNTNTGRRAMALPLRDELVGSVRPLLLVLYGAVAVVLLVACANVANLLLMRGTDREREMAVRVALGAGRGRLVRQLLVESLLLALGGGALALVFAHFGIGAILHAIPSRTLDALPALANVTVDGRVAMYAAAVSVVAGLVFGLVPAFRATQSSIYGLLKHGARGVSARGRLRDWLVISEIALTVILVSGAALFARSLDKLLSIDLGFRPAHITTAGVLLSSAAHAEPARATQVFDRLAESVRTLPGVESVGLVSRLPLNGGETWDFRIAGRPEPKPGTDMSGSIRWVGADYFRTLGIALRSGRLFSASDDARAPLVVIINDAFARMYFPEANPIGQMIIRRPDSLRVVGVVADVPISKLEEHAPPTWYVPMSQAPQGFMRIAVRGTHTNADLLRDMSRLLGTLDAGAAVLDPATMEDLLVRSPSVFTRRFPMLLVGVFGGTALVLALVGVYGVVSYSVGQRRRELGIRMALGAAPHSVVTLFLRHAAWMAGVGTALGIVVALLASRLIAGMLYGVGASDPVTYIGAATLLSAAALSATLLPALRAARVDPTITLRAE